MHEKLKRAVLSRSSVLRLLGHKDHQYSIVAPGHCQGIYEYTNQLVIWEQPAENNKSREQSGSLKTYRTGGKLEGVAGRHLEGTGVAAGTALRGARK